MQNHEMIMVIVAMVIATFITRALPFYVAKFFKNNGFIRYLGSLMPACVVFTLVIYSFKDLNFLIYPYGLPEIISAIILIAVHLLFNNALLSIGAGLLSFYFLLSFAGG